MTVSSAATVASACTARTRHVSQSAPTRRRLGQISIGNVQTYTTRAREGAGRKRLPREADVGAQTASGTMRAINSGTRLGGGIASVDGLNDTRPSPAVDFFCT